MRAWDIRLGRGKTALRHRVTVRPHADLPRGCVVPRHHTTVEMPTSRPESCLKIPSPSRRTKPTTKPVCSSQDCSDRRIHERDEGADRGRSKCFATDGTRAERAGAASSADEGGPDAHRAKSCGVWGSDRRLRHWRRSDAPLRRDRVRACRLGCEGCGARAARLRPRAVVPRGRVLGLGEPPHRMRPTNPEWVPLVEPQPRGGGSAEYESDLQRVNAPIADVVKSTTEMTVLERVPAS